MPPFMFLLMLSQSFVLITSIKNLLDVRRQYKAGLRRMDQLHRERWRREAYIYQLESQIALLQGEPLPKTFSQTPVSLDAHLRPHH
jgi:hypothetical protein